MKEMLRLELHRLVSVYAASVGGAGDAKKFSNLSSFMQAEIDRLEAANRELSRAMDKKVGALTKKCEMLQAEQERVSAGLGGTYQGLEDKVADVKSLLEMKAEKERVSEINGAIVGVRDDLTSLRDRLPGKEITDSLKAVKKKVEGKMDKRDMRKLLNSMKKDESDPAVGKRCLSCDRPLGGGGDWPTMGGFDAGPSGTGGLPPNMPMHANYTSYQILPGNWSPAKGGDRQKTGGGQQPNTNMYKDYAKPKSPYKRMSGTRPRSAHARSGSAGGVGGKYAYNQTGGVVSDAIKYGREKPLHVTLFANDKARKGKEGGRGKERKDEGLSQWEASSPETHKLDGYDEIVT